MCSFIDIYYKKFKQNLVFNLKDKIIPNNSKKIFVDKIRFPYSLNKIYYKGQVFLVNAINIKLRGEICQNKNVLYVESL